MNLSVWKLGFFAFFSFASIFSDRVWARMFERRIHAIEESSQVNYNRLWVRLESSERKALAKVIKILERSPTGKKILLQAKNKASQQGHKLIDILQSGEGSLTDTTLVRKFSSNQPDRVAYESHSKVVINRNLSVIDAVLDMAHELTHFTLREPFNPYREKFSLKDFIVSTVEGRGGEVDAYIVECQVFLELFPRRRDSSQGGRSNCHRIFDSQTGVLSKKKGIREFYKVGRYHDEIRRKLRKYQIPKSKFHYISREEAQFISSAYGMPYPIAAVYEYESIMERVCHNDRKRLKLLTSKIVGEDSSRKKVVGRFPASFDRRLYLKKMLQSLSNRCSHKFSAR